LLRCMRIAQHAAALFVDVAEEPYHLFGAGVNTVLKTYYEHTHTQTHTFSHSPTTCSRAGVNTDLKTYYEHTHTHTHTHTHLAGVEAHKKSDDATNRSDIKR
jgi:hypothetical protein